MARSSLISAVINGLHLFVRMASLGRISAVVWPSLRRHWSCNFVRIKKLKRIGLEQDFAVLKMVVILMSTWHEQPVQQIERLEQTSKSKQIYQWFESA